MKINIPLPKHFDQFIVRECTKDDKTQLAEIEFDPEVKQYVGAPTISKEDYITNSPPRGYVTAINSGEIVAGTIDMNRFALNPKKRELRILLAKEYRSRGFASEAAQFFISYIFGVPWTEGIVGVVDP